ncbi:MAG: prolyl oligopeptidase family serine peptidase [Hyphomonadaceae bacterium]
MRLVIAGVAAAVLAACATQEETTVTAKAINPDTHLYLEEVEGAEALAWVRGENERTLGVLETDARFHGYYDAALKIATSQERIPYGSIRKGYVYNFWQDGAHERGLWRRQTLNDYGAGAGAWETLLDVDALAKAEGANWVYKGVSCLPPEQTDCLLSLSDGGKDAVRVREYSIAEGGAKAGFVAGGFDIPEAKTSFTWETKDSLLIATDWGGDGSTLTESGYPFVIKRLKRGQTLAQAVEIYRGAKQDVATSPFSIEDSEGHRWFGASRAETFFTSSYFMFPADGGAPLQLPIPKKASPQGIIADTLVVTLEEDWSPEGQGAFKSGDLVGFSWSGFLKDGKLPKVELVFRPTPKQALQGVGITKNNLLLNISDNVVVKVMAYTKGAAGWTSQEVKLPPNGSAGVIFSDNEEATAFLGFENYLSPDTLYSYDSGTGAVTQLRQLPAWFDASPYQVDQHEATSKDGTKVPYFVVHKKELKLDGSNPTLVYGYGGFQVSQTPGYSGTVGKLWLEQGGVYVMANIRGGGEFGPSWHQAGLKTKRQVVYDDFSAVAEDLITKKITSKQKLGAMGGSNGGLLMGVMYTQRPDLFHAIVCQVPLLDMLRYNLLLAGASWMDEYGDPDVPEERAFLKKLSPYHNVDPAKTYPEIYFETSTKDDRVHPGHARKMAKLLEEMGKPFLYYENIDGGHSAAANQREAARRSALEFTYLARKLIDGK